MFTHQVPPLTRSPEDQEGEVMTSPHVVVMSSIQEETEYEDPVTRYLCSIHNRLVDLLDETKDEANPNHRANHIIEALIWDRSNPRPK
jgi:hypothetical protein